MKLFALSLLLLSAAACAAAEQPVEYLDKLSTPRRGTPVFLKGTESIATKDTFRPPVEITIEAKTDSTDPSSGEASVPHSIQACPPTYESVIHLPCLAKPFPLP